MCVASPRTGWRWTSLIRTLAGASPIADLDHLRRVRELVAQDAGVDREVLRVLAAAVDDAGDEAVPAEAPRGARALRIAGGEGEW